MRVDLSLLETCGKTAVHCTSEEQAEMFMAAMWEQYPDKVSGIWSEGQTNWARFGNSDKEIYYLPRISSESDTVRYCQSTSHFPDSSKGYALVEFCDLLVELDLGEFQCAETDIKSLFDMG